MVFLLLFLVSRPLFFFAVLRRRGNKRRRRRETRQSAEAGGLPGDAQLSLAVQIVKVPNKVNCNTAYHVPFSIRPFHLVAGCFGRWSRLIRGRQRRSRSTRQRRRQTIEKDRQPPAGKRQYACRTSCGLLAACTHSMPFLLLKASNAKIHLDKRMGVQERKKKLD